MTANEENVELESQFILRLPAEQAEALRTAVKSGVMNLKERLTIQLDNDVRHGSVRFDEWVLPCRVYDLPSIIESYKTLDKKNLYKTADISQIMICLEDESQFENVTGNKEAKDKKFLFPHGITPPLKNVRSRRFRKTLRKKCVDFAEVEKEVKRLFKTDSEAVSVRYEIVGSEDSRAIESHPQSPHEGPSGLNPDLIQHLFGCESSGSEDEDEDFRLTQESEDGNSRLSGVLNNQLTAQGEDDDDGDDDSRSFGPATTFDRTSDAQYSCATTSGPTTFENLLSRNEDSSMLSSPATNQDRLPVEDPMEIDDSPSAAEAAMEEEAASAQIAHEDGREETIRQLEADIHQLQQQRQAHLEDVAQTGNEFLRNRFNTLIANIMEQEEAKRRQIEELSRY